MHLTSAVALARGGKVEWRMSTDAALQVRPLVRRVHRVLSRCRMARGRLLRRRVPAGGARRAIVRSRSTGIYFTILGMPLLAAARRASRARTDSRHDQARAHRLDRHGQVDRRGDVRAAGVPVFDADAVVRRLQGRRRAGRNDRRSVSRARCTTACSTARACRIGPRRTATSCSARSDRPPGRSRGARRGSSTSIAMRRRCCSKFRCCSRPAGRKRSTRSSSSRRRRDVQRERVLGRGRE